MKKTHTRKTTESLGVPRHRSLLHRGAILAVPLAVALLLTPGQAALAQQSHGLPLVVSADNSTVQGFVRVLNRSDRAGIVRIHAVDDAGKRFGPTVLYIAANATVHLTSRDLEDGNSTKKLYGGVGDGTGDWRLELATSLDVEPLAYIRTSDGFLNSIHDVVPGEFVPASAGSNDSLRHHVPVFNPGSDRATISRLRVINTAGVDNTVVIRGVDDAGRPGAGEVSFTLPPYGARTLTAQGLEEGYASAAVLGVRPIEGRLGDGTGKWQLFVSSRVGGYGRPLQVMNLLFSRASGKLADLSTAGAGNDPTRGGPGVDWLSGGPGDDVVNPGDNDDAYDWVLGSPGNDRIVYSDSGASAYQALSYIDLDTSIEATVDGGANLATVKKGEGAAGTDTIVDVANPLNAGAEQPYGGFGLAGSPYDDTFDLSLAGGQWMEVRGEAGNDTINIRSGRVKVNYRLAPGAVSVDLGAGRASNDGYGNVDTITGDVWEVEGGPHDDMLRGSDRGDRLNGGAGNDTLNSGDADGSKDQYDEIEGSAGNDRIVFSEQSPPVWTGLSYGGLGSGITATIDGVANRATVDKGTAGTDTIVDVAKPMNSWALGVVGTSHDDVFNVTVGDGQNLHLRGDAGNDTFNIRSTGVTRLQYHRSPGGIDLDLAAGRANDDGFGGVDTINGAVQLIRCSEFDDVVRGSDNDEGFECLGGNDRIDGGGGYDRLFFHRRGGARGLLVVMGEGDEDGVATGSWNGKAFSYTFSNIEHVSGGPHFFDTFISGEGDDTFEGRGGENLYLVGWGNDTIVYFDSENDIIWLDHDLVEDHGLTHADVIAAARQDGEDVLIDLSAYGGGTVRLGHFNVDWLRTEHFKL